MFNEIQLLDAEEDAFSSKLSTLEEKIKIKG